MVDPNTRSSARPCIRHKVIDYLDLEFLEIRRAVVGKGRSRWRDIRADPFVVGHEERLLEEEIQGF
jgi:hypothetical protein